MLVFAESDSSLLEDRSGTNPAIFLSSISLSNEYINLTNGNENNITTLRYVAPFNNINSLVSFKLPFAYLSSSQNNYSGMGDLELKAAYRPYLSPRFAFVLGAEFTFNTAVSSEVGGGKNVFGPSLTPVFMYKWGIFAPTYKYSYSYSGDDNRADISQSVIDLYIVSFFNKRKNWLLFDPIISIDHKKAEKVSSNFKITLGQKVSSNSSVYIRSGIPIGGNKSNDFTFEVGMKYVW